MQGDQLMHLLTILRRFGNQEAIHNARQASATLAQRRVESEEVNLLLAALAESRTQTAARRDAAPGDR